MKEFKKVLKALSILIVVGFMLLPADFAFASGTDRPLTDRENAAFIVRDEWTAWVKGFTASLSELDKNATSRIYDNMDFYDMQYRFTEKYKKVPEYLDEDGKPTQKLKDLIKQKRKEINGAQVRDYLCFTSKENGSKVSYVKNGTLTINIGISYDGSSFSPWDGSEITLESGKSIYVLNKSSALSTGVSNYVRFNITGTVDASGDVSSLLNFGNLSQYSFFRLFYLNSGLASAEDLVLPAASVPNSAYQMMFSSCSKLNAAPKISATTLGDYACQQMFENCDALISAPELNFMTMGESACQAMFANSSQLAQAPSTLPAKALSEACYYQMFQNCPLLEKSPHIAATSIAIDSLGMMFDGCTSLSEISIAYTGRMSGSTVPSGAFYNWVNGVSNTGVIYYSGAYTNSDFGESMLPKNTSNKWLVLKQGVDFLTFTSEQDGSSVGWSVDGMGTVDTSKLYYSKNGGAWTQWASGSPYMTLNMGENIRVWNRQNTLSSHPSTLENNFFRFKIFGPGKIAASGNVDSMLNFSSSIQEEYALYELFKNCTGLTTAPKITFTTIKGRCFYGMFEGCTNLTTVPELKATNMYTACYTNMFKDCVNITTAPHLPATTLAEYCYQEMFAGCSRLNKISLAYTGNFSGAGAPTDAFKNWVNGVASSGIIIYSGTDTTVSASAIPVGDWTVQTN